jgi:hypothetical protein
VAAYNCTGMLIIGCDNEYWLLILSGWDSLGACSIAVRSGVEILGVGGRVCYLQDWREKDPGEFIRVKVETNQWGRRLEKPVEIVLACTMKSIGFTSMGSSKQGFRFLVYFFYAIKS